MKKCLFAVLLFISSISVYAELLDEIQVYTDDINSPGEWGLELHVNTTPKGITKPSFPGEIMSDHGFRLTPEISYGLTDTLEAGLYVPMVLASDGHFYSAGTKLRLKWLPIQTINGHGFFGGINLELSQNRSRFYDVPQRFEMRNILGWRNDQWLFAVNPIFGWDIPPGLKQHSPEYNLGTKISRSVSEFVALGFEYYNGKGQLNNSLPSPLQDKTLYFAVDYEGQPFNFNFGIGKGITSVTDQWTVKSIFNVPI